MKIRCEGEGLSLAWAVDLEGNGLKVVGYQARAGAYVLGVTPAKDYGLWVIEAGVPVPHARKANVIEAYVACSGDGAWAKVAAHLEARFFEAVPGEMPEEAMA